jgi:hypothetical protein
MDLIERYAILANYGCGEAGVLISERTFTMVTQ